MISGKRFWADGTSVAAQQFEYGFDDIGNRSWTKAGGDAAGANLRMASYAVNSLNQYTSRTVPGAVDILGSANSNATVTVNNQPTQRKGEYFRAELAADNSGAAVYLSLTNLAALKNGTNADITATTIGEVFLPKSLEGFGYDADGNLISDGRWTFGWDAENRLVSMESREDAPEASKMKLAFSYNYQGRRIQKTVWSFSGQAYAPQYTNRFVYDGWNLIAVLNPDSSVVRSFVWGLDLSGSEQGAGGVGGLLAMNDASNGVHYVAHDGNGNVAALVAAGDSVVSAIYEYGPFGEVLRATGPMAKTSPFRFSTKYQDDETDFLYYGYRYYNASTGRWLSRDPIGERGGENLYAFIGNRPIGLVDFLGLALYAFDGTTTMVKTTPIQPMSKSSTTFTVKGVST